MKKSLFILLVACLPLSSFRLSADNNDEALSEIPLRKTTETRFGRSCLEPVRVFYLPSVNSLQVSFMTDMGYVDVSVVNSESGVVTCDVFNSSASSEFTLPAIHVSGVYEVVLSAESGDVYVGSFIIN